MRPACAGILVLALVLGSCGGDDGPPLERALALVEDERAFGTAMESGDTFAHVGELLVDADAPAAAGWMQVLAAEVLECSLPEIHDARRVARDYVVDVIESGSSAPLPALPSC